MSEGRVSVFGMCRRMDRGYVGGLSGEGAGESVEL